ncbi:MAG: UDP-2,3-diacylglucosamine diphosphatase [Planctomycetota bacterium]
MSADGRGQRPEVPLEVGALLIGDLHLDVELEAHAKAFAAWLDGLIGTPRLVVLGDFFEYWIGPAQSESPGGRTVLEALGRLRARGTAVEVVFGNRDFLLDRRFELETGARLHPAGFVGCLPDGTRALVIHGDELCTLDVGYQRLRRVLRSFPVRWSSTHMPLWLGRQVARRLRRASTAALETKPKAEAQQQPDAVRALAAEAGTQLVVCGHAHEFRDERLPDGPRWIVVDAFGGQRDLLEATEDGELLARSARELARRA